MSLFDVASCCCVVTHAVLPEGVCVCVCCLLETGLVVVTSKVCTGCVSEKRQVLHAQACAHRPK